MKEGEHMAYRVTIVDDSTTDAEFEQGILSSWAVERQDNEAAQIVFITDYSDYITVGYEVAALHYLMKPVNREKLLTVLDRAMEKRKQERCLNLEAYGELVRILFYEIRYLDVHQNYVTI